MENVCCDFLRKPQMRRETKANQTKRNEKKTAAKRPQNIWIMNVETHAVNERMLTRKEDTKWKRARAFVLYDLHFGGLVNFMALATQSQKQNSIYVNNDIPFCFRELNAAHSQTLSNSNQTN